LKKAFIQFQNFLFNKLDYTLTASDVDVDSPCSTFNTEAIIMDSFFLNIPICCKFP